MRPCVYINLAAAAERRASVEAAFAAAHHDGWTLERLEARTPADGAQAPGALTPAEKACFASHRAAVAAHVEGEDPLFVIEDDTVVSTSAFGVIDALLTADDDWEVLFTDAGLCDIGVMVELARRRDAMAAKGDYAVMPLKGHAWFGANAYVVKGRAKRALHEALAEPAALDVPYDLFLRELCEQGRLKLAVCFPFATRLSPLAAASQLRSDAGAARFDRTVNAFRRLMAAERDEAVVREELAALREGGPATAELTGAVLGLLADPATPLGH